MDTGGRRVTERLIMLKRSLVCASLALGAACAAGPASADALFFEPYGELFSARTLMASPADNRPKDALQRRATREDDKMHRFELGAFYRRQDMGDFDLAFFGGGASFSSVCDPEHPFQVWAAGYNLNVCLDLGNVEFDDDFFGFDIGGTYGLWVPPANLPYTSVFFQYRDINDIGSRWDLGLAFDQRLSDQFYLTANLGYADTNPDGPGDGENDFVPGFGLSFAPRGNSPWSLHLNYILDNDVDGQDDWSLSAIYNFTRQGSVKLGGGKHSKFFITGHWAFD
jgi:hypothetical protein